MKTRPKDRTCYPKDEAPPHTGLVARCQICGAQWEVKSPTRADAKGCGFCGAPESAIIVESERTS